MPRHQFKQRPAVNNRVIPSAGSQLQRVLVLARVDWLVSWDDTCALSIRAVAVGRAPRIDMDWLSESHWCCTLGKGAVWQGRGRLMGDAPTTHVPSSSAPHFCYQYLPCSGHKAAPLLFGPCSQVGWPCPGRALCTPAQGPSRADERVTIIRTASKLGIFQRGKCSSSPVIAGLPAHMSPCLGQQQSC